MVGVGGPRRNDLSHDGPRRLCLSPRKTVSPAHRRPPAEEVPVSIPVVLLAGGLGTRLREETDVKPKPMVEVGGHPILWHIMKSYAAHGFDEFVVCLGYKGDSIKDFFLNYRSRQGGVSVDPKDLSERELEILTRKLVQVRRRP